MHIKDFSMYSDKELESIYKTVRIWEWDYRLGKKPFLFDKLIPYKKTHNMKYRMWLIFAALCPRTKADYLKPFMEERRKRKLQTGIKAFL